MTQFSKESTKISCFLYAFLQQLTIHAHECLLHAENFQSLPTRILKISTNDGDCSPLPSPLTDQTPMGNPVFIQSSVICLSKFNPWLFHILPFLGLSLNFIQLPLRNTVIYSDLSSLICKPLFRYLKESYFYPIPHHSLSVSSLCQIALVEKSHDYFVKVWLFLNIAFLSSSSKSIWSSLGNLDTPALKVLPTVTSGLGALATAAFPIGSLDLPGFVILIFDIIFIVISYVCSYCSYILFCLSVFLFIW